MKSTKLENVNPQQLQQLDQELNTFDKMKFVDDDGIEKIWARDLGKAVEYTDWRNFKKAIDRANDQIENNDKDKKRLIVESNRQTKISVGAGPDGKERFQNREVKDYKLTRKQAINVLNNADTSKPEVAKVQEWLYDTSEVGERAIKVYTKLKDREYIEARNNLKDSNTRMAATCLDHNVKSDELGIIHNTCDESLYHMNTQEIKDKFGSPTKPKADYLGTMMCSAEIYAKNLTSAAIDFQDAQGLGECSNIAGDIHTQIRNQIQNITGKTPEEHITGEYIGTVKKRYNKLTKEQLKVIEELS